MLFPEFGLFIYVKVKIIFALNVKQNNKYNTSVNYCKSFFVIFELIFEKLFNFLN